MLFISLSPSLRKSKAMLRTSSVRVATPKTQANTFPPPPSNSRAATAGTVLHCPAELCASACPVFVCEAARSWPQRYGRGPRGPRVNTRQAPAPSCGVNKSWPEKDLERQAVRKGFCLAGDDKEHTVGCQIFLRSWKLSRKHNQLHTKPPTVTPGSFPKRFGAGAVGPQPCGGLRGCF